MKETEIRPVFKITLASGEKSEKSAVCQSELEGPGGVTATGLISPRERQQTGHFRYTIDCNIENLLFSQRREGRVPFHPPGSAPLPGVGGRVSWSAGGKKDPRGQSCLAGG